MQPVVLQVIAEEVLEAHADAPSLHAHDIRLRHLARNDGVLGKVFEVAPVACIPLDVDAGCEQNVDIPIIALIGERLAHALRKLYIPGICEHFDGRKRHGGQRRPFAVYFLHRPEPHGPVRDGNTLEFPAKVLGMPIVLAADEAQLFLYRQFFKFLHCVLLLPPNVFYAIARPLSTN